MQQPDISKTLNGLSLSKTNGNRSSVVERVKWIEKTHGSINGKTAVNGHTMDDSPAAPRARLRLPKHFIDAQQQAAASTKTGAEETGILTAKLPAALETPTSKLPTLGKHTSKEEPSPAMSEATTVTEIKSPPIHSNSPSISSNESVSSILIRGRSSSNSSSLSDEGVCDPVHVNPPKAVPSDNPPPLKIKASAATKQRKPTVKKKPRAVEMPRSTKVSGKHGARGLGMATRRQPQETRRFDRSSRPANEDDRPTSSTSFRSNHSGSKPALTHSKSMGNVTANEAEESESMPTSLLARLNERVSCRPNLQDLVSNRSSPKFVKRSRYYSSTPLEDKKPIRDARRFK